MQMRLCGEFCSFQKGRGLTEGTYPDGMPHPPARLRWRVVLELATLALLTSIFLSFEQDRQLSIFLGMALIGAALVGFNAKETHERFWGPPTSPEFDRVRRCTSNMMLLTVPALILFFSYALIQGHCLVSPRTTPGKELLPLFSTHFLLALAIYVPWALLQQTLFQFYLLGRLRVLLPFASPFSLSCVNGIVYGLMHLSPEAPLGNVPTVLMAATGGIFWSYSYHRDRYVLPIAASHALLAPTFYFWVLNHDLVDSLRKQFSF